MLFNSIAFLGCFLPIVWLGWRLISLTRKRALVVGWLSLSSLAFYAYWNWHYAPLLLCSLGVNFGLGRRLQKRPARGLRTGSRSMRLTTGLGGRSRPARFGWSSTAIAARRWTGCLPR